MPKERERKKFLPESPDNLNSLQLAIPVPNGIIELVEEDANDLRESQKTRPASFDSAEAARRSYFACSVFS